LIKDSDTNVVCNAIIALNEILYEEGGMAINAKIIIYLLNKIKVTAPSHMFFTPVRNSMNGDRASFLTLLPDTNPEMSKNSSIFS
jgi:hypothetical protein